MKTAWRILAWVVPAVSLVLVAALVLFFEQVDPDFTCEWEDVCRIKRYTWIPLVPLLPLTVWNFSRQLWWPQMLLAMYLAYLGTVVMALMPAHYWGDYGNEAGLTALAGYAMFLVAAAGFFPAYRCGKTSDKIDVPVLITCVLLVAFGLIEFLYYCI